MKRVSCLTILFIALGWLSAQAQNIEISNNTCHDMTVLVLYDDPNGNCGSATTCLDVAWSTVVVIGAGQQNVPVNPPCSGYSVFTIRATPGTGSSAWVRSGCGSSVTGTFARGFAPCNGKKNYLVEQQGPNSFQIKL